MKASPTSTFIMPEPDLLFQFQIILLDPPAQLGGIDKAGERDVLRQRRKPIFRRFLFTLRPFDE